MTGWAYWMIFALAVVLWVAAPVCAILERRADERDAETWSRIPGATR